MTITFDCDECLTAIRVKDSAAGKSIHCPKCKAKLKIPSPDVDVIEDYDELEELPPVKRRASSPKQPIAKKKVAKKKANGEPETALWARIAIGFFVFVTAMGMIVRAATKLRPLMQPNAAVHQPGNFAANPNSVGPAETLPSQVAQIPLPQFPDLGPGRPVGTKGVTMQTLLFSPPATSPNAPGSRMKVRVYLPAGQPAPKSLRCVLVAPAGTPLIFGNSLDGEDYHDETLPYAEAGMVVVMHELDGGVSDSNSDALILQGYLSFRAAAAGVVNGRNALDFVLAKIPQVDPGKIFSAGHSSAGTESLLLAEHEPRLKGCIAYAPCTDVASRLKDLLKSRAHVQLLTGLPEFIKWSSPLTHVDRLNCPTFLFHAKDDSNVQFAETQNFAGRLGTHNTKVTLKSVPFGNHYQPMISEGIPSAIQWIQTLP